MIASVRRALGRDGPLERPPVPPGLPEHVTRLVHTDFGLPELFARMASENHIDVQPVGPEELTQAVAGFLQAQGVHRVVIAESPFLERLGLPDHLRQAGLEIRWWGEVTLDELYDVDCAVTDVYCAVAETGSLVIRSSQEHGRALSLIPPLHVAILQPRDFVPDLVDLLEKMNADGVANYTTIISGPSKTADIEMTLVTGVHGPGKVQAFVLQ